MDACVKSLVAISCRFRLNAPGTGDTLATIAVCAAARRTASCGEAFENEVVACLPQRGSLPNGANCATSSQCQSQFCTVAFGSDCGTCMPTVAAGGPCTGALGECAGTLMCVGAVCGTAPKLGEACSQNAGCRFSLACLNGRCMAPANAGESCVNVGCDIVADLTCRNGICERWLYANPGERCDDLAGPRCSRSGDCEKPDGSTSGTCAPPVGEGEACDNLNGPYCLPWLDCTSVGVCKAPDPTVCK
jgi:hypothetical protein